MKESTGTWGNGFPGEFTEEEIYEFFNTGILKDNSKYMKLRKDMAKYAYWYYKLLVKRLKRIILNYWLVLLRLLSCPKVSLKRL